MNNKHNFDRNKNNDKTNLKEADKDQSSFLVEIMNFKSKTKPQNPGKKQEKDILKKFYALFDDRERFIDAFESEGIAFSDLATREKVSYHSNLKILTPTKMLQRLPITLTHLKSGKTYENLLNESEKNHIVCLLGQRNY